MRSYSQISPTFWTRGSGKKLRGNTVGQLLALYFMTAPSSNMIGLYYLPLVSICAEVGLTEQQIRETMPALEEIVKYDFETELVWIPECAAYQIGDTMHGNDKRHGVVARELEMAGNHEFANEFIDKYAKAYGFPELAVSKRHKSRSGVNKGHPSDQMPLFPVPDPDPVVDPDPEEVREQEEKETINKVFEFWKKTMNHPTSKLDPKRHARIQARLREGFSGKELCLAIRGATKDDFLMGRDKRSIKKFDGIHTILRDAEKVESLMAMAGHKRTSSGAFIEQTPDEAQQAKQNHEAAVERDRERQRKKLHGDLPMVEVTDISTMQAALKGII